MSSMLFRGPEIEIRNSLHKADGAHYEVLSVRDTRLLLKNHGRCTLTTTLLPTTTMSFALRSPAFRRGFSTRSVEGFVGAVGNTPLVSIHYPDLSLSLPLTTSRRFVWRNGLTRPAAISSPKPSSKTRAEASRTAPHSASSRTRRG